MENDLQKAANMKLILCLFEQLSGLKINFHKSELVCLVEPKKTKTNIDSYSGVRSAHYPLLIFVYPFIIKSSLTKNGKL